MAFNETVADRIRHALARKKGVEEKKMFGGIGFLLNGNMLVGVWKDSLIVWLGPTSRFRSKARCRRSPVTSQTDMFPGPGTKPRPVRAPPSRSLFATSGFEDGRPGASPSDATLVSVPVWDRGVRPLATPLAALTYRVRGAVNQRIFAEFEGDWLSDMLLHDLTRGS